MLMPRRLGGSFGASNGMFRVLVCRARKPGCCGTTWTANDSHAVGLKLQDRETHEMLCASGTFDGLAAGGQ